MAGICRFLVSLLRRHKAERDLDEEIASCLDLLIEQHRLSGMSEEQAVRAARLEFGGTSRVKENVRDTRPGEALRRYFQDVRYAVRGLVKSKAFTLSCVLILALGIGANTAIFSILNAVLLRPLPYSQPDQLIRIRQSLPKMSELRLGAAPPEFLSYRTRGRVFSAVAGYQSASYDVTGLSQPQHVPASKITASLFQTLDVKPHIGRAFTASDEAPDAERVVLLSYAYWTRQNASDPHALSRTIRLDEQPYRIVGVMPPGFVFPLLTPVQASRRRCGFRCRSQAKNNKIGRAASIRT